MNAEILDKIKKLLRLGQSSNQHEAELAITRAFELAARHNIEINDIDLDDDTRRILHKRFGIGQRFSLIRKLTINILESFFNVKVILSRPEWIFIGRESDIEIAIYIHGFLVNACSRALRKFQSEHIRRLSATKKKSFIAGFMYGISSKLGAAKKQLAIDEAKTALALREKENRDKYAKDNFQTTNINLVGKMRRNPSALMSGWAAGRDTEINKGVGGDNAKPLMLTFDTK